MVLVELREVSRYYKVGTGPMGVRKRLLRAVEGVGFTIESGQVVGLVGESGCGKSTLGRIVAGLETPSRGRVVLMGKDLGQLPRRELRQLRRQVQMVFQDPMASLNPRMRVGQILAEPLEIHGIVPRREVAEEVGKLLEAVGLKPEHARRYPHQFSGGQRQRIAIARALALSPRLIVADEPVSALDTSVQAQVLNLLKRLQREHRLSYLFIAHDLAVVRYFCDEVVVMYLGRIVERLPAEALSRPAHPYTRMLTESIPLPDPARPLSPPPPGEPPSPLSPPPGCPFHPRCPQAGEICRTHAPKLVSIGSGRWCACHYPLS